MEKRHGKWHLCASAAAAKPPCQRHGGFAAEGGGRQLTHTVRSECESLTLYPVSNPKVRLVRYVNQLHTEW